MSWTVVRWLLGAALLLADMVLGRWLLGGLMRWWLKRRPKPDLDECWVPWTRDDDSDEHAATAMALLTPDDDFVSCPAGDDAVRAANDMGLGSIARAGSWAEFMAVVEGLELEVP